MFISNEIIILLMLVTLIAGYVDGIAGGGGLLVVPAMMTAGIPPHFTLGTNKLAASMGVFGSAYAFVRKGVFNPLLWKAATVAALIGSFMGVFVTHLLNSEYLKESLPILLIAVALYMLMPKPKRMQMPVQGNFKPKRMSSSVMGSVLGFYDGFMGPGTGSFWVTLVMLVYNLDMVTASGVARFMNFISNISALLTFIYFQSVNFKLGIAMGLTYLLGSYVGAHSAMRFGAKFIKPLFLTVVIIMAIRLVWTQWI